MCPCCKRASSCTDCARRSSAHPNLDLLTPARRVWRGRLESCSLKSLEYHVLDVHRDQDDIDGSLIPQIYFDYVRSGDAREMPRVMYHNAFDILSMVTLATRLIQIFDEDRTTSLTAADWYALGKWHADRAEHDQAERYLRQAVEDLADALTHQQAAMRLSLLYKQLDRRSEAIGLWEAVAQSPTARLLPSKPASNWRNITNGTRAICRRRWRGRNERWCCSLSARID